MGHGAEPKYEIVKSEVSLGEEDFGLRCPGSKLIYAKVSKVAGFI